MSILSMMDGGAAAAAARKRTAELKAAREEQIRKAQEAETSYYKWLQTVHVQLGRPVSLSTLRNEPPPDPFREEVVIDRPASVPVRLQRMVPDEEQRRYRMWVKKVDKKGPTMELPFVEVPAWTPRVKDKAAKGLREIKERTATYKAYLDERKVEWKERAERQQRETAAASAEYARSQAEKLQIRLAQSAQAREDFKNSSRNYMAWKSYITEQAAEASHQRQVIEAGAPRRKTQSAADFRPLEEMVRVTTASGSTALLRRPIEPELC